MRLHLLNFQDPRHPSFKTRTYNTPVYVIEWSQLPPKYMPLRPVGGMHACLLRIYRDMVQRLMEPRPMRRCNFLPLSSVERGAWQNCMADERLCLTVASYLNHVLRRLIPA